MSTGTIKWFNSNKGYGFIERTESGESDLFVHQNDVTGYISEGDAVNFEVGEGRQGPCAINVSKA